MPGCVDKIQAVDPTIQRLVIQRHRLGLDSDTALALDVHGIEHLRLHLTLLQPAADLDKPVRQGGFPVVDVGNDGKIAYKPPIQTAHFKFSQ